MLPFVIRKTPAASASKVLLCSADTKTAIDIVSLMTLGSQTIDGIGYSYHLGFSDLSSGDVPKYSGTGSNPITWGATTGDTTVPAFVGAGGYFYLEVTVGGTRFFSELLYISDVAEYPTLGDSCSTFPYIRLSANTLCDIGDYFPAGLNAPQTIFIKNGGVYGPSYEVERVVSEDGNGQEDSLWTALKKLYSVNFFCPESVADWAASLVLYTGSTGNPPLNVTDESGFSTNVKIENVTVTWPDQFNGIVAEVQLQYSIQVITQTGCC